MATKKNEAKKEESGVEIVVKNIKPAVSTDKRILLNPILSEKSAVGEREGQYTFSVSLDATKVDVKQAIKAAYGVTPSKVNMIHSDGKVKRFGRFTGSRKRTKKAIVILPKGQTITIHEGV